jgi:uncharacterized phage protein (TIGR01671 family)
MTQPKSEPSERSVILGVKVVRDVDPFGSIRQGAREGGVMREIKFRAWHRLTMKMDYSPRLFRPNKTVEECPLNQWIQDAQEHINGVVLMQFTGLHDKNGKEIFENDIVKTPAGKGGIDYRLGAYVIAWNIVDSTTLHDTPKDMIEVLGDIYSNPELLK